MNTDTAVFIEYQKLGIYHINAPSFARVHPPEAVEFPCPVYIHSGAKKIGMGI
ncbi:MAG: hypothetical protein K0R92_1505 [Lachnospiraceae bacterium]|jgi:hypothetical protein|nr:hypothetical protein [Lachnospiraceae bacterium]